MIGSLHGQNNWNPNVDGLGLLLWLQNGENIIMYMHTLYVYLTLSRRFERWSKTVKYVPLDQFVKDSLPPIDVVMVWHAYLLNPLWVSIYLLISHFVCSSQLSWYSEDTTRLLVLRNLTLLNEFFAESLVGLPNKCITNTTSITFNFRRLTYRPILTN